MNLPTRLGKSLEKHYFGMAALVTVRWHYLSTTFSDSSLLDSPSADPVFRL
jgi:hypothetical protein